MTTTAINGNTGDANVNSKNFQYALGIVYFSRGDFRKAIEYLERYLKISKEERDRAEEGSAYCYLGIAYYSLGDFQKAIEYHGQDLKISKEVGERAGDGKAYGNLGNAYDSLGDSQSIVSAVKKRFSLSEK